MSPGIDSFDLKPVFTFAEAMSSGVSTRLLYSWRDSEQIEVIARGVFIRANLQIDHDLAALAFRSAKATICLTSALSHHNLIDTIPPLLDVALPRGSRQPKTNGPLRWHFFKSETFCVGRETMPIIDSISIGIYNPMRSVIDTFRLRHLVGEDLANTALKSWLAIPGNHPSSLTTMAAQFPKSVPALKKTLKIFL